MIGVDGPQPSLVTSVSDVCEANKNKKQTRENGQGQTTPRKAKHTQEEARPEQRKTKGGKPATPKKRRQRGGQTTNGGKGARGEKGKRRPAKKQKEDAREGSRDRREETAQAKKTSACSFIGVLMGFRHHIHTHNMV